MTTTKGTILGLLLVAVCAAQAHSSVISAATIRVTASSPTGEGPGQLLTANGYIGNAPLFDLLEKLGEGQRDAIDATGLEGVPGDDDDNEDEDPYSDFSKIQ